MQTRSSFINRVGSPIAARRPLLMHQPGPNILSHVEIYSREDIASSDAPKVADRLEWAWVEDPTLDGASPAALLEKFRAWAAEEVERQPGDYYAEVIPRFNLFIMVDDEVLQSLGRLDALGMDWPSNTFVKFVNV
ncbi:hypothetical protein HBI56_176280 [Parastagonospora nodorum]|uniref:Uncharacterized protein n=1 Tax=Phaeosphaeria nodorum (strain SN15 / ATCC MYA-4574 / FGSC 10173) TaxID=321614 RepID=A0A7U2FIL3_PHANO|nr:hypothetical protein HBH56_237420 [Parastagonospora nodorum]QRD03865.1 hypothetical protein JI435_137290 [Parastagonospora nodorum SN15]KAH3924207.1 hypothetical protein HBH54_197640 [Parastagonospora nodorum]KAH3942530.1 hypothetical protein HBH53_185850 [Parastagonospora nodorum]KAH3961643.1 hypothetical protein HBH51_181090 [Parastagonospora nodorum]